MKLAFNGLGRYADFDGGYEKYLSRSKSGSPVDRKTYRRIIRCYCKVLADKLLVEGMVDLPCRLGTVAAVEITRKPQYRGKKFIGFGKMDWSAGHYDGSLKAFGIAYLPRHDGNQNLRCYGFVANRELFKRIKNAYLNGKCNWMPLEFNEGMI